MEARIVTITGPLSREIIETLNKLGNFPVAQMREAYNDAHLLVGVSGDVLQEAPPIFIKVVKYQVELIDYQQFLLKECLTAVKSTTLDNR